MPPETPVALWFGVFVIGIAMPRLQFGRFNYLRGDTQVRRGGCGIVAI